MTADFLSAPPAWRDIYCNRTLNLRAIKAFGYDMDYTLLQYNVCAWEQRVFHYAKENLKNAGFKVPQNDFDEEQFVRGLIIDTQLGNIIKADRFGYVKVAMHGTKQLTFKKMKAVYSRTIVDLTESRYLFMSTLFSLSEASLYAQLVDQLDAGLMSAEGLDYAKLYEVVHHCINQAHIEGKLKQEIAANPKQYIIHDPEMIAALLDQKYCDKKLLLITNSDYKYAQSVLTYAFNQYLPDNMTWQELFDLKIFKANKPKFFTQENPTQIIQPHNQDVVPYQGILQKQGLYLGSSAQQVEQSLQLDGDEILYVGDHIYSDVNVSKKIRRWRTALILSELEDELQAQQAFYEQEEKLISLMKQKSELEFNQAHYKTLLQRLKHGVKLTQNFSENDLDKQIDETKGKLMALDKAIQALVISSTSLANKTWGLLMRTGNDKSHLARQLERHADIYTSRVSNFYYRTPLAYFRSTRGSLPHDDSL